MFRPTLKRSKLEEITLTTHTPQPPHHHHLTIKHQRRQTNTRTHPSHIDRNIIFPTSLFHEKLQHQENCVFNPLNYEWTDYPSEVRKSLHEAYESDAGRAIGCYKNLMWHFKGKCLYIWQCKKKQVYQYQIEHNAQCLQIGQIASSSLHFKTRNLYIVAVGVTNHLFLFGIEKNSFKMSNLNFAHIIPNSRYIQKIKFVNSNEIIVASDTSHISHFDFSSETRVSDKKISIFEKALPFLPLLYPTSNTSVEEILLADNLIYCLIRQEKPAGWLSVGAKKTMNYLMHKSQQIEYIIERKRIEVYQLDRINNQIKFMHKIKESQFIRSLKLKHPQTSLIQQPKGLHISSIFIEEIDSAKYLSVVTNCGYFASLIIAQAITVGQRLLRAPRQNNIGIVGIYLQKKAIEDDTQSKDNEVRISLGLNNLTLMNNCLWYLAENAIQAVKCDRLEGGDIIQIRRHNVGEQKWYVFTRMGFYTVSRFATKQVMLSYFIAKNRITTNFPERSTNETTFNNFLQNIGKILGYEKICQALIECVLQSKEVRVAQPLIAMIEDQLRGSVSKDYRDWNYVLSRSIETQRISVQKEQVAVWKHLIDFQYKPPKREFLRFVNQSISCDSYWYALRNIFVRYSAYLLKIEPKHIKNNKAKIDENILLLQGLLKFFFLKKDKEKQQSRQALVQYHSIKKELAPKSLISHLRPLLTFLQNKSEQKTQASINQSTIMPQKRHLNQSSSKLEDIISASIARLKDLINVFVYLVDISQSQGIPSIQSILRLRKERQKIRRVLLRRVQDLPKLKQFSALLPELQLQKTLQLNQWIERHQHYNNPIPNLPELALYITSQDFVKIKQIFGQRLDLQMDVLLLYWDYLQKEIEEIIRYDSLNKKAKQMFGEERAWMQEQRKQYIRQEMIAIQSEAHLIFNETVRKYANSNEQDYQKAQRILNNTITIITSHHDQTLIQYAEEHMTRVGLSEKIMLLRKHLAKKEKLATSSQILNNRIWRQPKESVERQFLSSFQLISTHEQQEPSEE